MKIDFFYSAIDTISFILCRILLTLVLLNPVIACLYKQYRSYSVGFWRNQLIWICTVFPLSIWTYSKNADKVIWLAENYKWVWHLNLFSRTRVKITRKPQLHNTGFQWHQEVRTEEIAPMIQADNKEYNQFPVSRLGHHNARQDPLNKT